VLKLLEMRVLHLCNAFKKEFAHMFLDLIDSVELCSIHWCELESIETRCYSTTKLLIYLLVIEVQRLEFLEEMLGLFLSILNNWIASKGCMVKPNSLFRVLSVHAYLFTKFNILEAGDRNVSSMIDSMKSNFK
jgi:hypothetical protein